MVVAQAQTLSAGKGAELIRAKTGRNCTRQNLEKLCKQGKLPRSTASAAPVRVRADLLVEEYLGNIDERQSVRAKPGVKREVCDETAPPPFDSGEMPAYTISQQRKAFEQANLLELERRQKEGQLVARSDVETTWATVAAEVKTKIRGVGDRARQRIPHLSTEDVTIIRSLIDEALEALASKGDIDE